MIERPELHVPTRVPDVSEYNLTNTATAHLWLPDTTPWQLHPQPPGLLVTTERGVMRDEPQPALLRDMDFASSTLHTPKALHPLYNYLGVYHQHTYANRRATRSVSFLPPTSMDIHLAALDVPVDHAPPRVGPWEGGESRHEVAIEELANNGRFLVSTEANHAFHDTVVCFALAQVLVRPNDLDRLAAQAQRVRGRDPELAANFMDRLDMYLSSITLGRFVAEAFAYEAQAEQKERTEERHALQIRAMSAWGFADSVYAKAIGSPRTAIKPQELREHCLILSAAAQKRLTPATD